MPVEGDLSWTLAALAGLLGLCLLIWSGILNSLLTVSPILVLHSWFRSFGDSSFSIHPVTAQTFSNSASSSPKQNRSERDPTQPNPTHPIPPHPTPAQQRKVIWPSGKTIGHSCRPHPGSLNVSCLWVSYDPCLS